MPLKIKSYVILDTILIVLSKILLISFLIELLGLFFLFLKIDLIKSQICPIFGANVTQFVMLKYSQLGLFSEMT